MQTNIMSSKDVYFFEESRHKSFKFWPFDEEKPCNIKKMAEAGFYWSGNDKEIDSATCFVCEKVLDGWEETDDPWLEHKKHAPQCAFIKYNRPEDQLTIEEIYDILEAMLKNRIRNQHIKNKAKVVTIVDAKKRDMKNIP